MKEPRIYTVKVLESLYDSNQGKTIYNSGDIIKVLDKGGNYLYPIDLKPENGWKRVNFSKIIIISKNKSLRNYRRN